MHIGVVFPQTEYPADPSAVREYAQTAEALGFSHIVAYDHVLGANPDRPGGWSGLYTHRSSFLEPFSLFSFLAGVTTRIGFAPGVIILPQRQTALVAKQAATLDVLCSGRLRLGIGLGWNAVEYQALGMPFTDRGRRMEEQVALLRALWTESLVTFHGRWHTVDDAGLNPLPVQRPIPLWFGGMAPAALRRMARLGDGWMTNARTPQEAAPLLSLLHNELRQSSRSAAGFGVEARIPYGDGRPEGWQRQGEGWRAAGATHLTFNTMGEGFATPSEHLAALQRFAEAMGLRGP
jgi:probable F420-dependent oxidoreductase